MKISIHKKTAVILTVLILIMCCICTSLTLFGFYVFNSNNNIPIASDLVEKLENAIMTEEQFGQAIVDGLVLAIDSYPSTNLIPANYYGFSSDLYFKINAVTQGIELELVSNGDIILDALGTQSEMNSDITLDISGIKFDSKLEYKSFIEEEKSKVFFKLSEIPSFLTMFSPDLEQIRSKWVLVEGENANMQLNDDLKQHLIQLIKSQEFLDLISRTPDKVFENIRAMCVSIKLNEDQFRALSERYKVISGEEISIGNMKNIELNSELCFGRRDSKPYLFEMTLKAEELNIEIRMQDFKYPTELVQIEKPLDFIESSRLNLSTGELQ